MNERTSVSRMAILLACGIAGCILMGSGDWLMIYGDTAFHGSLAWLTDGVASIPPVRNTLAMITAFPAVILYSMALFGMRTFIERIKNRRIYSYLTAIGFTPWLCLHLFYTMILYLFGWMTERMGTDAALAACEALFGHFSWIVIASEVLMLLPFIYMFILFVTKETCFPGLMCINNPLIIYIVLKIITMFMPDTAFRLAFTNGLMSESMLIWFVIFLVAYPKVVRKR